MDENLSRIEKKIDENNRLLNKLLNILQTHIEFIENAYSIIRYPLNFITSKLNFSNTLPSIK